uniref:Uncharacterized protein n=1 Tax=Arundo donax TaxID=35708 RepID=A0A0A9B521_ARUDO
MGGSVGGDEALGDARREIEDPVRAFS